MADCKHLRWLLEGLVKLTDCRLFSAFLYEAKPLKLRRSATDNLPGFRSESGYLDKAAVRFVRTTLLPQLVWAWRRLLIVIERSRFAQVILNLIQKILNLAALVLVPIRYRCIPSGQVRNKVGWFLQREFSLPMKKSPSRYHPVNLSASSSP